MYKHDAYFFDMDQTLTRSKTEIEGEHFKLLSLLSYKAPIIIVSGAVIGQMMKQVLLRDAWYLAQNGNHAMSPDAEQLWYKALSESEKKAINTHVAEVARSFKYKANSETVQDRGCQVSFSLVGHDADLEIKEAFDPERSKRKAILSVYPFQHPDLTVRIGGTTCLDYTRKDGTKGQNVSHLIKDMAFENPIYVGDALFKGGNDESVVGVCETLQVDSVKDTYQFIKQQL